MLTPTQAAKILNISATQVRYLIRQGKIKAEKVEDLNGQFYYAIPRKEIRRVKGKFGYGDSGQKRGYPQGRAQKEKQ